MYRILLVDDEILVRDAIKENIDWGAIDCELVGDCENGKQAAEFVKEHPVDIVLTDILMPYMDGMELSHFLHDNQMCIRDRTTPSTVKYGTVDTYAAIVAAEAKKASVPVCLHLDHGSSFELAMQAMHAGYTSVMIEGSKPVSYTHLAILDKNFKVMSGVNTPNDYMGPGTGYRVSGKRWEEIKAIPHRINANDI